MHRVPIIRRAGEKRIRAPKTNSVSRVVIPDLTLPGNPGSNLTLVTVIEIRFVFGDESRILPRI